MQRLLCLSLLLVWLCVGSLSADEKNLALLKESLALLKKRVPPPQQQKLFNEFCTMQVNIRKVEYLLRYYQSSKNMPLAAQREIELARLAQMMLARKKPILLRGRREEGYHSPNDDSYQPFVRFLPSSYDSMKPLPLVVYLHGYSPNLNIINYSFFIHDELIELAQQHNFLVAMPFGRSNTDFQGIGEQDVLTVISEMQKRYAVDADRIILAGMSMGGMGTWTIGSRYPHRFAALLVFSGRGDYYKWQNVTRKELPVYKQVLIDREFGYSRLQFLSKLPVLCFHGSSDTLIGVEETRHMMKAVRKVNRRARYIEIPDGDHWICADMLKTPEVKKIILESRRNPRITQPPPVRSSRIKSAFLKPFMFVHAGPVTTKEAQALFKRRCFEWYRYAKAWPRSKHEKDLTPEDRKRYNLFVFGEPEFSPLIRAAMKGVPIKITDNFYMSAEHTVPRKDHGLYVACPNPWNDSGVIVVQSGLPWGQHLSENHRYDFLPDFIIYGTDKDTDGSNRATLAGFFDEDWSIDTSLLHIDK